MKFWGGFENRPLFTVSIIAIVVILGFFVGLYLSRRHDKELRK